MMDRSLKLHLQACEARIKEGSTTFYKAFSFLPSPRKEAVYVIYAFCRMIDDATDEPEKAEYTPAELAEHFEALDEASGHFIWPALRWLFETFPINKQPFRNQMEGQRLDSVLTHYDTMAELERYCYLVAGTVGEMLLPVLHDAPDEEVIASGIWLGKAMQIVNIIRDVGEDKARGRRYLPLEFIEAFDYSQEKFEAEIVDDSFKAMIDGLSKLAREWFELGLKGLDGYPRLSGFCVDLAAAMYAAILESVTSNDYDVYNKRAYVSATVKASILHRMVRKHGLPLPEKQKESSAVS